MHGEKSDLRHAEFHVSDHYGPGQANNRILKFACHKDLARCCTVSWTKYGQTCLSVWQAVDVVVIKSSPGVPSAALASGILKA